MAVFVGCRYRRRVPRRLVALLVIATVSVAVAAAAVGSDPEPARAATVVSVPNSIDGTGNRDVTGPINSFLAGVAPGTTVTFAKNARYRIEGVLILLNPSNITIDGNGATFFATTDGSGVAPPRKPFRYSWPRRREHWDVRGAHNLTMRNFTVRGANPNGGATPEAYVAGLEGQAGIAISRTDGIVIDNVTITDTYGDFVWITGASTDVTIRNSTFARSGRQGVAIVGASGVVIQDNKIRDVARSVIDLEPLGKAQVTDLHVRRNQVGDYRNFLLAAGGGGPGVSDIWLEANRVDGGNGVSVAAGHNVQQRRGYHFTDNTGTGAVSPPAAGTGRSGLFQLMNLTDVEIRRNVQRVADGPAMSLDRVCNLTVAGNQFLGASPERTVLASCGGPPRAPKTPTTR